jgi:hypothetical protein
MSVKNRSMRATRSAIASTEVATVIPSERIRVYYSATDGSKMDKTFKSLAGAQKFAALMMGEQVEFSKSGNHAVSFDGVGKITADGVKTTMLFPAMLETKKPVAPIPAILPLQTRETVIEPVSAPVPPVTATPISEPETVRIIRHMIQPGHYTYIYMGLDGTAHTVTTRKINKTKDVASHWTMTHAGVTTKGDNVAAEYNSRDLLQAIADKERAEFARLASEAKAKTPVTA